MSASTLIRKQLADTMAGNGAHIRFDQAVSDFPAERAGEKVSSIPHTAYSLAYHIRLCIDDVLSYCDDAANYEEVDFPGGYWPSSPTPPNTDAWQEELDAIQDGIDEFRRRILDESYDIFALIPGTKDATFFHKALIIADHNSYHIAELVNLRMLMGIPVKDW
ncbi:DinB family protein [Treponema sp.]